MTDVYTIKSLSERWMCSPDVIYDLIREGKLKSFRVGRAIRVSAEEVKRYEQN